MKVCACKNCCIQKSGKEGIDLGCLCDVKLNYWFIYPFVIAMIFSVMLLGHTQANMKQVEEQIIVAFDIDIKN